MHNEFKMLSNNSVFECEFKINLIRILNQLILNSIYIQNELIILEIYCMLVVQNVFMIQNEN